MLTYLIALGAGVTGAFAAIFVETRLRTGLPTWRGARGFACALLAFFPFALVWTGPVTWVATEQFVHGKLYDVGAMAPAFAVTASTVLFTLTLGLALVCGFVGGRRFAAEKGLGMPSGRAAWWFAFPVYLAVLTATVARTALWGNEVREFTPVYGAITPLEGAKGWRAKHVVRSFCQGALRDIPDGPDADASGAGPTNVFAYIGDQPVLIRWDGGSPRIHKAIGVPPAGKPAPRFATRPKWAPRKDRPYAVVYVAERPDGTIFAMLGGDPMSCFVTVSEVGWLVRPPLWPLFLLLVAGAGVLTFSRSWKAPEWGGTLRILAAWILLHASAVAGVAMAFYC